MSRTKPALVLALIAAAACEPLYFDFSTKGSALLCMPGEKQSCYHGPVNTEGAGICRAGTKTCAADGKSWGACEGEVLPRAEDCATPEDEDCDGKTPSCACSLLWATRFGSVVKDGFWFNQDVAVDSAGNILLEGYLNQPVDFGGGVLPAENLDHYVVKLDPDGKHLWSKSLQGGAEGIAVDGAGNVLVAAGTVMKFDPSGNTLWTKATGCTGVAADSVGNVYITGELDGSMDLGNGITLQSTGSRAVFVAKLDALDGHPLWAMQTGGDVGVVVEEPRIERIAVDAQGNAIVAGSFVEDLDFGGGPLKNGGERDIYVAKLDTDGKHVWSKRFGGPAGQELTGVAVDLLGNVLLTGFSGDIDFGGGVIIMAGSGGVFAAKLGPDGQHAWSKGFGDSGFDDGRGVASDLFGNVLLTGTFAGTINFGNNPLASASDVPDTFLDKRSSGGDEICSKRFSGQQWGKPRVTSDPEGNIILTEFCHGGPIDFGNGPVVAGSSGTDLCVAKFKP